VPLLSKVIRRPCFQGKTYLFVRESGKRYCFSSKVMENVYIQESQGKCILSGKSGKVRGKIFLIPL